MIWIPAQGEMQSLWVFYGSRPLVTVLSNALDTGGMYVYKDAAHLVRDLRSFIREERIPEMRKELQKLVLT